jgi:hypothetical protein
MIKPNELRLNNYVFTSLGGWMDWQVKSIGQRSIVLYRKESYDTAFKLHNIEPIPLDESWLLRFGFTMNAISHYKDISYFKDEYKTLCVTLNQGIMVRSGAIKEDRRKDEITVIHNTDVHGPITVHKLMNVYYMMTGEELELKA